MRLFRRTEFGSLVVATPQDLASSGADHLVWREGALRRRQDNESTTDVATLPTTLSSDPPESAPTLVPDVPNGAATPSPAASSDGSGLLGLSLGLLPTAAAAAATSSTPAPAAAAATSAAPGSLLGLSVGAGLGGASTPTPEAATSAAPTSIVPETPSVAPTSIAAVTSVQPVSSSIPASSAPPATDVPPAVTLPTTESQAAPAIASSAQLATTQPAAQGSPAGVPIQQSSAVSIVPPAQSSSAVAIVPPAQSTSAVAIVPPAQSSSAASISVQSSAEVLPSSVAPKVSSAAILKSSSATGQLVTLTSQHGKSQVTFLSTIAPTAAADLNNPTLATSMITSVTKTGSVPGVTTETTGSGIVVTETLKPSNGMSSGTMAGVIVGSAAGGLIIAALILLLVRKFIRARRIAKAESPPSSPLLNVSNPPFSPTQPLRIEVGMHQRMRSDDSDFWVSGKGSSINEKEVEGHGYPMPISPLPRLPESQQEMDTGRSGNLPNGGFSFFPNGDRSGEGKEVVPRGF